eukprot:g4932.t1
MGPELIDFSLGCLPGNTTRIEKYSSIHIRCCADKGRLTSFATSLARIHTLEELKIPASLALHEIYSYTTTGAGAGVATRGGHPEPSVVHRRRVQLQEFAEAFADNCKWIGFHGFALSLVEVAFLLGRLADDRFWAKGPPELRRALCAKLQEPPVDFEEEMSITTVPTTALFIDDW